MNREILLRFQYNPVKIVFSDNFVLIGVVDEVFDDCISFRTPQKTSIIRFERIMEISQYEGRP